MSVKPHYNPAVALQLGQSYIELDTLVRRGLSLLQEYIDHPDATDEAALLEHVRNLRAARAHQRALYPKVMDALRMQKGDYRCERLADTICHKHHPCFPVPTVGIRGRA